MQAGVPEAALQGSSVLCQKSGKLGVRSGPCVLLVGLF